MVTGKEPVSTNTSALLLSPKTKSGMLSAPREDESINCEKESLLVPSSKHNYCRLLLVKVSQFIPGNRKSYRGWVRSWNYKKIFGEKL